MNFSLKKRTTNINFKLYSLIALSLFLVIGMGVGYSYIRKELNVNGKVEILNGEAKSTGILGIEKTAYLDNEPSPYVASETGIDFGKPSSDTNGKGLYIWSGTEKSNHPIYYYRGEVNDNNVVFAGFCWKIVRTTDTGGTKLIYNGIAPFNNTCTIDKGTSTQINTSVFYTDGISQYKRDLTRDSTIKGVIDSWYETYLKDYTSYLEDIIWCNDMTYGAQTRIETNKTPNPLTCPNKESSHTVEESTTGNGLLIYPVSLITADEANVGGFIIYQSSKSEKTTTTYLYTGEGYWTLTPYNSGSVFHVAIAGELYFEYAMRGYYGVRPTVSLKPGTKATKGDGTGGNPYIIE